MSAQRINRRCARSVKTAAATLLIGAAIAFSSGCGKGAIGTTGDRPSGPGAWPLDDRQYGAAEGIAESPVVGASTDEAQNLWWRRTRRSIS